MLASRGNTQAAAYHCQIVRRFVVILLPGSLLVVPPVLAKQRSSAVRLRVTPTDALIDAPVSISLTGVKAGTRVRLSTQTVDLGHRAWRATATFKANARVIVDPSRSRALSGSYRGVRPMGLFWSMLPVGFKGFTKAASMFPAQSAPVRLSASVNGRIVARTQIVRRTTSAGVSVQNETLAAQGFIGRFCSGPAAALDPQSCGSVAPRADS
jgi:hypothetical protein